jgi:hypothetical protein
MDNIPAVDKLHVKYSMKRHKILIRAFDKNSERIVFPNSHSLKNASSKSWYNEFKEHFTSDVFNRIYQLRKLRDDVAQGTVNVGDPSFII